MSKIVIIGASGYVGTSTVASLLKNRKSDTEIVAVTRDITKDSVKKLQADGATIKPGSMAEPGTLAPTLPGASAVYIVVPGHHERTRLALNALNACKQAKVGFVLMLSVCSADRKGEIFADQFKTLENATQSSGLDACVVRFPMFLENIKAQYQAIVETGKFYTPIAADKPYNSVSVADVGDASASILLNPAKHVGKTYNIVGNLAIEREVAIGIGKVLGKDVQHIQVPYEAAKKAFVGMGFPEWQTDGILELMKGINEDATIYSLTPEDTVSVLQRDPISHDVVAAYIF